jgi:DNA polymerase elongation subunit (family B)
LDTFYTNIQPRGNVLLLRGFENGKRISRKVKYKPYLFIPTDDPNTKYRSITGRPLAKIKFDSIKEAREFLKEYGENTNATVYGFNLFQYVYLNEAYQGTINYDSKLIRTVNIDIEVDNEGQTILDTIEKANCLTTAITMRYKGKAYAFGCGDYTPKDKKTTKYFKCEDEAAMLLKFLDIYKTIDPDVITGWNIEFFDVPFLVNRITNVLGREHAEKLSPWGILDEKTVEIMGKDNQVWTPLGVTLADYLSLYKKFTYTQQESYKLDNISQVELGVGKLDYSQYDSLYDLYKKDYQLFMEYNDIDTLRVEQIDNKMGLLNQLYAIAYDAHVNYSDALTSVRLWDVHAYRKLSTLNIPVNPGQSSEKVEKFRGAYVKDPHTGRHKWCVSFDLDGLYPHIIMQDNISPEKLIDRDKLPLTCDDIRAGKLVKYREMILAENLAVAGSGHMYSREGLGFFPALMAEMYEDRKIFKGRMLAAEEEYERTKNPDLIAVISQNNNMQMAKKICLNSAYGAMGNPYFRWYDIRMAESITLTGQVVIQYTEEKMNIFFNKMLKTEGYDYVIASDTDSLYFRLDNLVKMKFGDNVPDNATVNAFLTDFSKKVITPKLKEIFQEYADYTNAYEQKMNMKLESIADTGIWTGKKHYILNVLSSEGIVYEKPKIKVKGIEIVKSSTPLVVRNKLKEAVAIILTKTEDDVIKFISDFRAEHRKLGFEDIAKPTSVSSVDKYTLNSVGIPIHSRGALIYNKALVDNGLDKRYPAIHNGEKIKYCYLKTPNPVFQNVIASPGFLPKQLGLDPYLDHYTMFEKTFMSPMKSILDAVGWKTEKRLSLREKLLKQQAERQAG